MPNVNAHPEDEEDDKLTRRFFLYDTVTGRETSDPDVLPKVIRYAKTIRLTTKIQRANAKNIYPPLLEITYAERKPGSFGKIDTSGDSILTLAGTMQASTGSGGGDDATAKKYFAAPRKIFSGAEKNILHSAAYWQSC